MKIKKIRGHKRRHKQIEEWRLDAISENITPYLEQAGRGYTKICVHPWNGIDVTDSATPEPKGKTKLLILEALLDIYDNRKEQFDKTGKPYYLKIWLFEPRFSNCQVVYAAGEHTGFYKNTFSLPEKAAAFKPSHYGYLKERLEKISWEQRADIDVYFASDIGTPELYASPDEYNAAKIDFARMLKKPHTMTPCKSAGLEDEVYGFEKGIVWVGGNQFQ